MKRGIFDIILFLSLFILPWWVGGLLIFVGIFIFENFYEFIVAGVIIYGLYTIEREILITSPIFFSALILVIYFGIQFLRHRIIFYTTSRFN